MAVAAQSWQVGALRAGASTARGLRSPQRYASVPERAGSDGYGRLFGLERSLHHLAAVAGPLLAFVLLTVVGVRSALLGAVIPGALAVAIGLWLMRRAPVPPPRASRPVQLQIRAVYSGRLGRLMTGITLFEAANFAAVLLILRATKLLEQGDDVPFGPAAMGVLLYLLWRLAAAGSSFVCGRLVDRHGPAPVISAGIAALLVSYAGFAFVEGTVLELAVCFAGAGFASGAIEAGEHVGVAQIAPEELRWSAFGSLSAVRSFGRMTATIGAAAVWTLLGPEFGLLFAAPLMLASIAVMATGLRTRALSRRWLVVPAVAVLAAGAVVAGHARPGSDPATDTAPPALAAALQGPPTTATAGGVGWELAGDTVRRTEGGRVHTERVGRAPAGIALGAQLAWVANAGDGTVDRLDRATGAVVGTPIGVGARPGGIALAAGRVWIANAGDDTVSVLDAATAQPVGAPIPVGDRPAAVAFDGTAIWVANAGDGTVTRAAPVISSSGRAGSRRGRPSASARSRGATSPARPDGRAAGARRSGRTRSRRSPRAGTSARRRSASRTVIPGPPSARAGAARARTGCRTRCRRRLPRARPGPPPTRTGPRAP